MVRTIGAVDERSRKYRHSFARQYLYDHNIKMYCGDQQILTPIGEQLYKIKIPVTRFNSGEHFAEQGEFKRITSYEELRDIGFVIISKRIRADDRWDTGQKVQYLIKRINETGEHINKIPRDHYVEFDTFNKSARLVGPRAGPLGTGVWMGVKKKGHAPPKPTILSMNTISKNADSIMKQNFNRMLGIDELSKPTYIEEVPFMITNSNEIVCMPKTPDMPSILITGMKSSGKSFCLHSLVSRLFWNPNFRYKICILNDSSRETGTWCLPNKDPDQINILNRLNERPLPLPTVYLHPIINRDYEKLYIGDVGFEVTIPFKEIITNHKNYLKLDDSSRYFTKMKEQILKCKTEDQVLQILDTMQFTFKLPPQTANKIYAEFNTIFDSKMTDISTKGQLPWTTSKNPEKQYNPYTALIHAGVLPILETEGISSYDDLLSIYFTYFAGDIFYRQKQDEDFVNEQSEVLLVIDEAHRISKKGVKSGADNLLRLCVREGRPRRVGTILSTQKFNELPDIVKDNSTYLIVFKNPGEAQEICTQYHLGKQYVSTIKDLDKHQCIAYSTEYFIVYDSDGKKRKSNINEVFTGKTLPPFSQHKRPQVKEEKN